MKFMVLCGIAAALLACSLYRRPLRVRSAVGKVLRRASALAIASALVGLFHLPSRSEAADKKACTDSVLCVGLIEHYDFEEGSDAAREGSAGGGVLLEPDGQNVANAVGKFGNAVSFAGTATSYLNLPESSNFGTSFYTLAFWVYPTSAGSTGQKQAIISTNATNSAGETLYLENVAGNLQARWQVTRVDGTTATASSTTNLALSTWHLIIAYVYPDFLTPTAGSKDVIGLQVNNGTVTTAALDNHVKTGFSENRLGGQPFAGTELPFTGRIDSLTFLSRYLMPEERSLLWNSGTGRVYPFARDSLYNGLVGYWTLREPAGSQYRYDSTANANHLEDVNYTNESGWALTAEGPKGPGDVALYVDGIPCGEPYNGDCHDDSLSNYSGDADLAFGDFDFSVSIWIRPQPYVQNYNRKFVSSSDPATPGPFESFEMYLSKLSPGDVKAEWYDAGYTVVSMDSNLSDYAWYHVVYTYKASTDTITMRVNDADALTFSSSADPLPTLVTSSFIVGAGIQGPFLGRLSRLGKWNRVLTAAEITALYGNGVPPELY